MDQINPDDFALMNAIAAGDQGALSQLYDRHSPLVLAICRRVLNDPTEAEAVLTDIFFEVWTRADRFDPSRGSPVTYLVTLSRSRAIDRKRSAVNRPRAVADAADAPPIDQPDTKPNPFESVDLKERSAAVRAALSELEPAQREALECAYYEGLSHTEIAERLKRPLGTVKTCIRQGIIRLRDKLRTTQ